MTEELSRLKFIYPWPHKNLSPNARVHWARKSRVAKTYRDIGKYLTLSQLRSKKIHFGNKKIHLFITFYPPDRRRRDEDNLSASLKSLKDGLADALGVDDRQFQSHPFVSDEVRAGGEVVITIAVSP